MTKAAIVAAVGVCGAVSTGIWLSVRPAAPPIAVSAPTPAHSLPVVKRAAVPWARWTVTEQHSAHGVIVLQVETTQLGRARAIAMEVSAPLQERNAEVLIYFHRPGRPDALPPRRVQWSRAGGFVETNYER